EELETLFVPFGQAEAGRKASEGTGLGLPISHRFVQLMGGEITVSSTVGRGSCFQFDLNLATIEKTALATQTRWLEAMPIATKAIAYRIMIADDRPESRLLMVKLMESLGLQIKEAKNGQEAVVLWESWQPHLIWMDMQMPGMDGYHATQQIKARSRLQESDSSVKTAIVALTASAFERDRTAILSAGCDDFVSKPFREEIILEKLARYLGVRYCFAEPIASTHRDRPTGGVMPTLEALREELSHLPDEWILQSYQAAIKGSDRILLGLIEQIPPECCLLTPVLKDWVGHFRFDRAIELLKPMAQKCQSRIVDC
ncbi:MAG: response regulator, partial [Geitlerinemataceae cyanobacterium]